MFYCRCSFFICLSRYLRASIAAKLCTRVCTGLNFENWVKHLGAQPKKFRGQKHAKFGPILDDFKIWWQISSEWMKILKIRQVLYRPWFLPRSTKKYGELWSTNYGDLRVEWFPSKWTFLWDHVLAPRGCCIPKFLHILENDQVLLAHTPWGTGCPLTVFLQWGSKIGSKFIECMPIILLVWLLAPPNLTCC